MTQYIAHFTRPPTKAERQSGTTADVPQMVLYREGHKDKILEAAREFARIRRWKFVRLEKGKVD